MSDTTSNPDDAQRGPATDHSTRVRLWTHAALAVAVVVVLFALGIANIVTRARWHEVEDGVLWVTGTGGVVAAEVAPDTAATRAGIQPGDLLVAIDGVPVQSVDATIEAQHRSREGTTLSYTVRRGGTSSDLDVALAPSDAAGSMYFLLASVGLFTLLVGGSVRLRRPKDQATLHFFWLCVAFYGWFTLSFNGPLDRLDWFFYWGDAVAAALLPPLLLHFALVFPARSGGKPAASRLAFVLMYAPALLLGAGRMAAIAYGVDAGGRFFSQALNALDRLEPLYLLACVAGALLALGRAFRDITSLTGRRQLRWITWGIALGVGPFALGYALPWMLGLNPPVALQFTAVPLGLLPLAFASAIVRYRLRDVEVIIKRGVAYAAFLAASVALYFAMRKLAAFAFADDGDPHNWVVALLATVVVVLLAQPVKEAVQNALDRLFYRDRYDYRRALVAFARDLNSDLDVVRLSRRLVSRVVETLAIDRMALMLADDRAGDFRAIGDFGFPDAVPALGRDSTFMGRLDAGHPIALDDPMVAARYAAEEVESWRDQGVEYFVPCTFEGAAIAVLALGRKSSSEPFNSEDFALLAAVAGQVATAIENGRLYRQLHVKAEELGRMREFNENILESLEDGLVVFDADERVVRLNRALERLYGVRRVDAIGRGLAEVFDAPFVEGLRAALRDQPLGATLFKVPLTARRPSGSDTQSNPTVRLLVNATAVPLQETASDGTSGGTILLIEDITDRVRLEEQLQISEKMASLGLLAAGVAHEVNTPLTGISSYTQMLLEGADPGDPRTAMLQKIERQTFRAAKIVNGLLTLSRPGASGNERMLVDLNIVVADVASLLEHQFEIGKVKLRRELSPMPVYVLGIEHQLQQVFLNLFLNARDAMPRGGWLTVSTGASDGKATAVVADTGSGIPSEHLARIYDPFFTTKAIGRGTGLGLSITYGIVQEHDGVIGCDSGAGQGTRFILTFPLTASAARSAAH